MPADTNTYWARYSPEDLGAEVLSRWRDWRRYFANSGMADKADKGRRYYFGLNDLAETSSRLQIGGSSGQYIKTVVNKIRPVIQRSLAMLGAQTPEMVPVAANSDAAAREQAISARGILDHFHRELDTDAMDLEVLEIAITMGEGFRLILWDPNAGEPEAIDPETNTPAGLAGDFDNHVLTPFDVARDPTYRSWRKLPWVIARPWWNRWELAARYPDKAERILAAPRGEDAGDGYTNFDLRLGLMSEAYTRGDAIPVHVFVHTDCWAVPGGRVFMCLADGTPLIDGPNPYRGIPLERVTPGGVIGTSMGYSNVFDALGVSDLLNSLQSVIATDTVRWGTRPLVDFEKSNLQESSIGNGRSLIRVSSPEVMPRPLEVPEIPAEVFAHSQRLGEEIERLLGMNATAMGNPPYSGMAAQAMALLDQKAKEFNDGLAKSYASYKQACETRELRILKAFAKDPRVAVIQGKAKQWMLKSFTSEDIGQVDRVAMEAAPPGTGTLAWKMAMVEMMAGFGVQLNPEQVVELARTGQFETPFEHDEANRLRIKAENEGLQEGRVPPILVARTHWLDIPEHLALLSAPDIVEKPEVVQAVLSTVQAKLEAWRTMPPDLLALLGGPPPPMPVLPAAPGLAPTGAVEPQQPVPPGAAVA